MYIWVAPSYKWPAMGVFESTSGGKTDEWISGTQVDDILGERTIYAQSYCVQGEASPLRPRLGMVPLPSQFCKISVWPSKIGHTVEKPKSKSIQPRSQKVGSTYGEKCDNNLNPSCETTVHCQALLLIFEHKEVKKHVLQKGPDIILGKLQNSRGRILTVCTARALFALSTKGESEKMTQQDNLLNQLVQ